MSKSKKIAVLSGGGADGAFTVGRLSKLNKQYDGAVCVSTGSLMSLLAMIKDWTRLKAAYQVRQNQITETNPFNKKGKIKKLNFIWTIISGQKSLGDSEALLKYINETLKEEDWIKCKKFEIKLGVHSATYDENIFVSNQEVGFKDFKEWTWISSNAPLIMSLAEKKRPKSEEIEQFCDGGVTEGTPIQEACKMAGPGGEVDVFLHKPQSIRKKNKRIENFIQYSTWFVKRLFKNVNNQDIENGLLTAEIIGCKVNLYFMPKEFYKNPFIFNKKKMTTLYYKGIENYNKNVITHDFTK